MAQYFTDFSEYVTGQQPPDYTGRQWADLADYSVLIKSRLLQCNADKEFIKDWSQQNGK